MFKCLASLVLLVGLCWGQTIPVSDAPSTVTPTCTENSGKPCPEWLKKLVGQYPPGPDAYVPTKSWHETAEGPGARLFWIEHGTALAASVLDAEATHQGLAGCHDLIETNPDLPQHPSRTQLYVNFLAFDTGFTLADFLLRKANIRFVTHIFPAYATAVHIQGAVSWKKCL